MEPDFKHSQTVFFDRAPVPIRNVVRRLGYPFDDIRHIDPGIRDLLEEEIRHAQDLFEPKGICRFLRVLSKRGGEMAFQDTGFRIQSMQVTRMLADSDPVVFLMVTIGPKLEEAMDRLLKLGQTTRAYILDAIGSETVDALADDLHWNLLKSSAEDSGYQVTPRFSAGYGDWPLTVQKDLIELVGGGGIGVTLTPSCLMIPRKSVSAVLGWKRKE